MKKLTKELLLKVNEVRHSRPDKLKQSAWPPDNVEKIAPYETAKEIADAYDYATFLDYLEDDEFYELISCLEKAFSIVAKNHPRDVLEVLWPRQKK